MILFSPCHPSGSIDPGGGVVGHVGYTLIFYSAILDRYTLAAGYECPGSGRTDRDGNVYFDTAEEAAESIVAKSRLTVGEWDERAARG